MVCCLIDNAANITNATKAKGHQIIGWTHLPCLAHTINLVVRDALKGPPPVINNVREAVEYFHRSTVGAQKLKETQLQMKMDERPRVSTPTKKPIVSTLAITNAPVQPLSPEEWTILQEIYTPLKPFGGGGGHC